ncbi:MAG: hypothetical protein HY586_07260, partial [Candidatus Omnitrophica bacterium]|nr:hypothetical protein [Candidatus Omnitrophota bacterium]
SVVGREFSVPASVVREAAQEKYDVSSKSQVSALTDDRRLTTDDCVSDGLLPEHLNSIRILGQAHASFIVGEYAGGVVIIDQHAAHERVQFEQVLESLEKGGVESQGLLMPVLVQCTVEEEIRLKAALDVLVITGFKIEPFGQKTYAVQAVPSFVSESNVEQFLKDYLARREHVPGLGPMKERREEIAALIACKGRSVKAHDKMMPEEMSALLQALGNTRSPFSCPHGRPVLLKLPVADFEKHFGRK